jgi:hypothetical protein
VNNALEVQRSITEESGNQRKYLKNDIHVSMRKAFNPISILLDSVKEECNSYSEEFKYSKNGEETGGVIQANRQVASSVENN